MWSTSTDRFSILGTALSGAGDFNGDGFGDFVVGLPYRYLFPGPGIAILELGAPQGSDFGQLVFQGGSAGTFYGVAVAGGGDLDDDGFSDVIVSSAYEGVYVYLGGAAPDTTADLLLPPGPARFGIVVASIGDWNADGFDDFVVGAPLDSTSAPAAGRAYVYFGGAVLDGTADVVLSGGAAGDQFGSSMAGGVDVNGDGLKDLVVSAPFADGASLTDCGEVQVFFGGPGADAAADLVLEGAHPSGDFGRSVALLADFNGDGEGDVAAGAPAAAVLGRVFVYYGGPGLDAAADWTVAGSSLGTQFGVSIAAGDDVNRDHVSDLIVVSVEPPSVYFGGAPPDTLADAPLSLPVFLTGTGIPAVAGAGDVNGDGYQEWLYGRDSQGGLFNPDFVGLFTAHGDLQLADPNGGETLLGGADVLVSWAGPELADIEYTRDGSSWQTLATGTGGSSLNSATVTIPPGRANRTARLRVASRTPADTVIDIGDGAFSVTDSIQTECFGTTAMPTGTAVTWSAIWPGYPNAARRYRVYRQDGIEPETLVGGDQILDEGILDTEALASSRYRLVALRPDESECPLDTVITGSFSCDSIQLIEPNGGESLFLANFLNVVWTGTRPTDVQLSHDDGQTWETVRTGEVPPSTTIVGTAPATQQARVRVLVHGVGGAVWDDSDAPFTIQTDLELLRFVAIALPTGGVALEWDTAPEPSLETFLGYRLCRGDTIPDLPCTAIGPWPNPATGYTDPAGTPGSVYGLWATLFDYTEVPLGDVTVASGPGTSAAFGPSPARTNEEVVLTMVTPPTANGPATDVEVRVYDTTGRMVALLGTGLGIDGTITLRWTPAQYGMRAGIYWIRARSVSAGFESNRRIVVL